MAFYNLALIYLPAIVVFMLIWRWSRIKYRTACHGVLMNSLARLSFWCKTRANGETAMTQTGGLLQTTNIHKEVEEN